MKNKSLLVNLSGVALAFAIAFGGIFALWSRLDRERAQLLSGGGQVGIPAVTDAVMSQSIGMVDVEIKAADLSQEELRRAVLCLESASEKYPHEPVPGQLSMTEATQSGMVWLGDFLLPRLDREGMIPKEYRLSCYLWADSQAEAGEGAADPLSGYWEVSFAGEELDAVLFLNAVTGGRRDRKRRDRKQRDRKLRSRRRGNGQPRAGRRRGLGIPAAPGGSTDGGLPGGRGCRRRRDAPGGEREGPVPCPVPGDEASGRLKAPGAL